MILNAMNFTQHCRNKPYLTAWHASIPRLVLFSREPVTPSVNSSAVSQDCMNGHLTPAVQVTPTSEASAACLQPHHSYLNQDLAVS